jgi:hypothetical protein
MNPAYQPVSRATVAPAKSGKNNRRSFDFGRFAASAQDDSSGVLNLKPET